MYRVCIDVGGTFTDCLVLDSHGALTQVKTATTPSDFSQGFMNALTKAAARFGRPLEGFLGEVDLIIHGTTLATNVLINRNGAKTGMITTRDFRDVIEIRRGYKNVRTSMYNVFVPPYKPLVPRHLRLEARERTDYSGEILTPLDEGEVRRAAEKLRQQGCESVVVGFLHSYANPHNESRAREVAAEVSPDTYITTSSEILSVWREWERFSTAVVSGYVGPAVERYLDSLATKIEQAGFGGNLLMMLSSGLVETVEYCKPRAVYLIGSGPAAAPAAAVHLGDQVGTDNLLSFDMGGTSIDIGIVNRGEIPTTTESWVQDERVAIKMVDVHSAGAGGGSIAWIDQIGLLRVGPHSAGSDPGPACYGNEGTEPTTTDADVVLGYVPTDFFLGGEIPLYLDRAETAIKERIADPLGMTVPEAAQAILTAVSSFMADEILEVATRRGYDVRDVAFVAGGGAGPVHAPFIADLIGASRVVVPTTAATYSAFGMFAMDVGRNFARSYITRADSVDLGAVEKLYGEMEQEARDGFSELRVDPEDITYSRTADLRYVGQFHEVEVRIPEGSVNDATIKEGIENFNVRHEQLYTFNMPWKDVEFLTFRLRATTPKAPFEVQLAEPGDRDSTGALKRHRSCWWAGEQIETPVYDGAKLLAGNRIEGPAIIEEVTTTVVVPPSFDCDVDRYRNYVLSPKGS